MEFIDARPSEDGKATLITVAMSPKDAERLMKALASGELKRFSVGNAWIETVEPAKSIKKQWAQAEAGKRKTTKKPPVPGDL